MKECAHSAVSNCLMDCKVCNYGQVIIMMNSKYQCIALCNNFKCSQGYKLGDNVKSIKILELDEKLNYHKLRVRLK